MVTSMVSIPRVLRRAVCLAAVLVGLVGPRSAAAQACAPNDSGAAQVRGAAKSFLIDPDEVHVRNSIGITATDTAAVTLATDSAVCQQAFAPYAARLAPDVSFPPGTPVYIARMGTFYLVMAFLPGSDSGDTLYVVLDSAFTIRYSFALM